MKRQHLLLAALAVILVAAGVLHLMANDDSGAVGPQVPAGRRGDPEEAAAPAALPTLQAGRSGQAAAPVREVLELKADTVLDPRGYKPGRDPWRFGEPPPPPKPPPPKPPTAAELARQRALAEEEARRRAELERLAAIEAARPKPPPFILNYLGRFGPVARPIAVFSDGKTIYNVREGEMIENRFIVSHIGYESVDIGFVGFPAEPSKRVALRH
ncbi:MAG TPA: hypothetical protein VOA87_12525 [Thermoanaerobaculia bacterium]|nr:hypothetical protein [Thermoanaerobaculia bacterium]